MRRANRDIGTKFGSRTEKKKSFSPNFFSLYNSGKTKTASLSEKNSLGEKKGKKKDLKEAKVFFPSNFNAEVRKRVGTSEDRKRV